MMRFDDLTPATRSRILTGFGLRMVVAVALVWLVDSTGLGDAGDRILRRHYYELRGQRDSAQQVILVAIDAPTLAAWGPPPWQPARLDGLFAAISRGRPAAVGLVDDQARLIASPGRPREPVISGPTALEVDAETIDKVLLRTSARPTATAEILKAAGIEIDADRIAVNFIGQRGLPTLSALEVARGNLPSESFTGKIVVIGLVAQPYAGLVPSPIGPLTEAQLQAHAVASAVDGVSWSPVAPWSRWLQVAILCAIVMLLGPHLLTAGTAIAAVSMAAAICLVDYLMFVRGVSLGATRPLIALVVAAAIERIHERLVLRHHVDDIARWTRQWSSLDAMRTDVPVDEQAYWLRVATLARLYMGCTSTIVAEVPQGRSRLKLRVIHGTTPKEIAEKRRDVRRSPYRKPHLTLGPVWHDGFMVGDRTATLLMPLVVGTQLLGFWIVNFPNRELVTEPHMALIKTLAHEIAMAIERRRHASATSRPLGVIDKLLGSGRVSIDLAEVRRSFAAHTKNQQELLTLGESMPFGVFVATLWGEIRYLNTAMKLACKEAGIDVTTNNDSLPDVLCQLTGFHTTEMHQHLRKLVQELEELHLRGRDRMDRVGRDFVLSWLRPIASDAADAEQLILVCAVPRRDHDRRPEGARSLAPLLRALHKPTDDHSVTIPRLKVDLDPGEARPLHALPQRLPAASELEGALAYTARRAPFIPDATLRLCRPEADRDPSEITFVAAGTSSLSARSLPVVADAIANPDLTVPTPFTSFEDDDSH